MEENRPKLTDPNELAIIKSIYFKDRKTSEKLDPIEELERMEARQRNNAKSNR